MAIARPLGQHWTFGHQAVAPIAPVTTAPNPGPIIPFALLCLGLILLAIAGTIVLSLIPTFTSPHSTDVKCTSTPFTSIYNLNNGVLPSGSLSTNNELALQSALNSYLANQNGFSRCSIEMTDGNVGVCPASQRLLQKRRTRRLDVQLVREKRQTNTNCNSQQLTTTSTLNCGCTCVGTCLNRKIAQLRDLLLAASVPVTFPDPTSTTVLLTGTSVPTSPTTATTTTTIASTTTTLTTTNTPPATSGFMG